jgi:hypothetical protein
MQKTFVTILLLGSAVAAFPQGTVYFSNNLFTKVSFAYGLGPVPTTPGLINYGLFYGIGESTSLTFLSTSLGVNSTAVSGVIASPLDGVSVIPLLAIPGTQPGEDDVWVQVAGWTASFGTDWRTAEAAAAAMDGWFGETGVLNLGGLGSTTGPGVLMWQLPTGTDPHRFAGGFVLSSGPEPSTMALFGLGFAALLTFRRRK